MLYNFGTLGEVKRILHGLRLLKSNGANESEIKELNTLICTIMYATVGRLKKLEPFMREANWVQAELFYERSPNGPRNCVCKEKVGEEEKPCGKECRGKMCADCWTEVLKEIHGTPGHVCKTY